MRSRGHLKSPLSRRRAMPSMAVQWRLERRPNELVHQDPPEALQGRQAAGKGSAGPPLMRACNPGAVCPVRKLSWWIAGAACEVRLPTSRPSGVAAAPGWDRLKNPGSPNSQPLKARLSLADVAARIPVVWHRRIAVRLKEAAIDGRASTVPVAALRRVEQIVEKPGNSSFLAT